MLNTVAAQGAYPPSFDGNPLSYGFALFSLTLICSLALAMLMRFLYESRARREMQRFNQLPPQPPLPWSNPVTMHRCIVACFLATILFGALPDVLVLLAWGGATVPVMDALFMIDRIGDGMTFAPFTAAVIVAEWGRQVMPQQLIRDTDAPVRSLSWRTVKDQIKIVGVVFIIAAGVTIAKANVGL